jgi:hypothetical protein
MLKKIFILSLLFSSSLSKCFNVTDIRNSDSLFSYKNNVYDITGYSHPGGMSTIQKTVGMELEPFMQMTKYKFHLDKKQFYTDLEGIFVGELCSYTTTTKITDTTTKTPDTTTKTPDTTTKITDTTTKITDTTTKITDTTKTPDTTTKIHTTTNTHTTTKTPDTTTKTYDTITDTITENQKNIAYSIPKNFLSVLLLTIIINIL